MVKCLTAFDNCERKACATATAWGLLNDKPIAIVAFWCFRHALYATALFALIELAPGMTTYVAIAAVFVVAHSWKLLSFIIRNRGSAVIEPTAENTAAAVMAELSLKLNLGGRSSGLGLGVVNGLVQVISVGRETPGEEAKLRRGDCIVEVDGVECGGSVRKVQAAFVGADQLREKVVQLLVLREKEKESDPPSTPTPDSDHSV